MEGIRIIPKPSAHLSKGDGIWYTVFIKDEDFAKLSDLFDSKLKPLEERLDAILETTQATAVAIDKQIGVNEDLRAEQAAADGQLMRHEGWIKNLAEKADLKLEY